MLRGRRFSNDGGIAEIVSYYINGSSSKRNVGGRGK